MNFKSALLAAALLISTAAASAAPITLTPSLGSTTEYSATFAGNAAVNSFTLDLTSFGAATEFFGQVSANLTGGSGYNVTGVTFDGLSFVPVTNTSGKNSSDYWTLDLSSLTASVHQIIVSGTPLGNSPGFVGSLSLNVSAVPEAETYAMMMAGMGLVGFMARRRRNQA
nr:FxDxF family PEP-CTERM protein [uncultured Duganella sp.]